MYPVIRLITQSLKYRGKPLALAQTHVSSHYCLPWDLDPWKELNNGRTLTLYDLGRAPFATRVGITAALRRKRWGMTVAGSSVRYRRRIKLMHRIEMRTRAIGWDHRFLYVEQSMWRGGEALNHVLLRLAVTDGKGIVAPERLIAELGEPGLESPALPDWVQAWIAADAERPWPPMGG